MERCRAGADVQLQLTRSPQEEGQNSDSKHRHPEDNGTVEETEPTHFAEPTGFRLWVVGKEQESGLCCR